MSNEDQIRWHISEAERHLHQAMVAIGDEEMPFEEKKALLVRLVEARGVLNPEWEIRTARMLEAHKRGNSSG